ncbi:GAF domain-containing protein [Streptomyces cyaneochromogenes]|uniref:protein-serine/threonine phosphatase n=1 Tax=Streptomyces cyaneochromogenes TaxID=2496836 RepID=A0A3S9M0K3_9ACTN|nr:GAF domain-containing protein [Streptomyces cyaneochromogenes]
MSTHPAPPEVPAPGVLQPRSGAVLTTDRTGRVTFFNRPAERLLGLSDELLGRVLWDAVPHFRTTGVNVACQQATTTGKPTGFSVDWPRDQRLLRIQLFPVPTGMALWFTDVTGRQRRAEETAAENTAAKYAERIVELTQALAMAVTGLDVVNVVEDHAQELFGADAVSFWCRDEEHLDSFGNAGNSPEFVNRMMGALPPPFDQCPAGQTLIERAPTFISSPAEYIGRYPHMADVPTVSGKQAWAFLPLLTSDRPIGVCIFSYGRPHEFTPEERNLFTVLCGLIAQALARARLYDAEHRRSHELQRGLLPRVLPSLPGVTTTARYLPAGDGAEVGGDWYDVIPLPSDRVALVIGDVMGHGLREAAIMGQLRTAVRTLADLGQAPDELFYHLNSLVADLGDDHFATCLCAVYDPTSRLCTLTTAGHPPPVIVHPDGTHYFADLPDNPPLGIAALPYETTTLELPEGSLLALYTDGLVQGPSGDLDAGMAELSRRLARTPDPASTDLDTLCGSLLTDLSGASRFPDDAALLLARTRASAPRDIACWQLPEDPKSAGQARKHVRDQLTAWGLGELAVTTELLASELIGNVIRHARGPITLRLLRSRALICEVSDRSLTMPRIRHAADTDEDGRGLQLVAAVADRWGARYTESGKCIWTEQSLTDPDAGV